MKFLNNSVRKHIKNSRPTNKGVFIASLAIIPILSTPMTAHAGLFSFLSDLTGDMVKAQVVETVPVATSQNMALLQAAVNLDPNPHKVDEYSPLALGNAFVAEVGPQGTVAEVKENFSTEISIYTVHQGDTLSEIAEMFGVSVNTIVWANELGKNPVIREGQQLVILPITGIRYTVKKGDTIQGIVNRHKSNLEEVLQYNDITLNSILAVGDVIVIPDAEMIIDTPKIATPKSSGLKLYPGYYIRPLVGGKKSQGIHGNNAVDLAAPVGTVIKAAASGKVISSISNGAWNGGYGNYVIISHDNGTQTLYSHNQKNYVSVGDTVEQGQMIAKVGVTGKTTGPHLHFEIRGGAKNPF